MDVLLVAATPGEADLLWKKLKGDKDISYGLNKITYNQMNISILITGVGLLRTAFHLGEALTLNKYQLAINFGVAGSFNKNLQLGEVVQIIEERVADAGAEDNDGFIDLIEMNLIGPDDFPYEDGKLKNKSPIQLPIFKKVKKVIGVSSNKASGNLKTIENIIKKYNPDVESLEGAAFFYSCFQKNIPCAQLRSISNYVEPRNKNNWELELAIRNITETMMELIEEINKEYKKSLH